ncbi:putative U3 small nucleolar RNA-associated protein 6 [Lyophyllum shimeji]|uniref:U3 small nucleolar RNA-associated protein 6 n=1 Tax=Lyophyllum shimeji TaxID=47721 RepID=A0A9P3PJW9_LYOSH|nr:putative U3 small nucleolar RNA-associated protein 6 [Lyophyllum shimeji]
MERVQFQQEQMLDELKDLVEKNLFTEKETKQIMRKRTAFETAVIRRVAKKADFLRYASYEMTLEQLRRKRAERIKSESTIPSISDYALVRRQFHIFERALKKFKSDVGLWVQYIQVAQREGARALVGRITARALQLHPNRPALYILAASHELNHQSHSSARTLLQRGIRLNEESIELWREYVKMELGFTESLRRRWEVLGINGQAGGKSGQATGTLEAEDPSQHIMPDLGETAPVQELVEEVDEEAASRKEILQGAIVKSVISSAVRALPKIELFEALNALLMEYPSPLPLRQAMQAHLYDLLRVTLQDHAGAIKLLAGRFLTPDLKGEAFVDGLRRANEEMVRRAEECAKEDVFQVYSAFVEEWCGAPIDDNMKEYLVSTLRSLIQQRHARGSPSLLSTHVRLLTKMASGDSARSASALRTARKYTKQAPKSAPVWLSRLVAEERFGEGRSVLEDVWREAREAVEGSAEEVEAVWTWGLFPADAAEDRLKMHEVLLKESMRNASLGGLHETLLMSYSQVIHEVQTKPGTGLTSDQGLDSAKWLHSIRHMASAYLTSGAVWQKVFTLLEGEENWGSGRDGKRQVLGEVYEKWRRKDAVEATLEWARWLLGNGKGKEAAEAVVACGRSVGEDARAGLEKRWISMVG